MKIKIIFTEAEKQYASQAVEMLRGIRTGGRLKIKGAKNFPDDDEFSRIFMYWNNPDDCAESADVVKYNNETSTAQ